MEDEIDADFSCEALRPSLPLAATSFRIRRVSGPPEAIVLAARWYLRHGLSDRDVEKLLVQVPRLRHPQTECLAIELPGRLDRDAAEPDATTLHVLGVKAVANDAAMRVCGGAAFSEHLRLERFSATPAPQGDGANGGRALRRLRQGHHRLAAVLTGREPRPDRRLLRHRARRWAPAHHRPGGGTRQRPARPGRLPARRRGACRGYGIMVVDITGNMIGTITGFPDPARPRSQLR
jgi:hypothetical protein